MKISFKIIFVLLLPVSLSKPQWQSDTTSLIIREYEIQVNKEDILITSHTTEQPRFIEVITNVVPSSDNPLFAVVEEEEATVKATSHDDHLTDNPSNSVVDDDEDLTLAIHVSSTSTVLKTYIREQWSLSELLSNSLTFGNSPIGTNSHIKLIVSMLLLLGILIFIMFAFYKLFIRFCYKPVFVIDYV